MGQHSGSRDWLANWRRCMQQRSGGQGRSEMRLGGCHGALFPLPLRPQFQQQKTGTMSLTERINEALKRAMKDKDKLRLGTLRLINAVIKDQAIARRGEGKSDQMTDDEILALLGKMTKQRQESLRAYEEGGRLDLAEREKQEISIIAEFLPRQLTDEEVAQAISDAIEKTGATSIRDMGKVMGELKAAYTGQMDFGAIGPKVKNTLSN